MTGCVCYLQKEKSRESITDLLLQEYGVICRHMPVFPFHACSSSLFMKEREERQPVSFLLPHSSGQEGLYKNSTAWERSSRGWSSVFLFSFSVSSPHIHKAGL